MKAFILLKMFVKLLQVFNFQFINLQHIIFQCFENY